MSTTIDAIGAAAAPDNLDRRDSPRKACRVRAVLDIDGHAQLAGKTLDIGQGGVSLLLPCALGRGRTGSLVFSVFVNGQLETIRAGVEVSNCVFLRAEVRVGFRFVELDPSSRRTLAALMR